MDKQFIGKRLDVALSEIYNITRSAGQKLIKKGVVLINGKTARPSLIISAEDNITLTQDISQLSNPQQLNIDPDPSIVLDVLYEDGQVSAINKPAGLVVHPGVATSQSTLVHGLIARYPEITSVGTFGEFPRYGIVHRLDKDTSGVMIIAKTNDAFQFLQQQFAARTVKKTYLALVHGNFKDDQLTISNYLVRSKSHPGKRSVVTAQTRNARQAITEFRVLIRSADGKATLLEAHPVTGRTHQIRVQLAHRGYPIVGDKLYTPKGNKLFPARQFLHASSLEIEIPIKGKMKFEAPLPQDLRETMESFTMKQTS